MADAASARPGAFGSAEGRLKQPAVVRVLASAGLLLAVVMQTIDSTIANVALPHMQGSLSAGTDQMTWVLTSYIVATGVMMPLSGWLALKFGRKPIYIFSITTFVLASVLCGMATTLPEIVLFRLFQGAAAAGLMPLSQAALLDIWSPAMMPKIMAVWSSMIMVGPIIGPTLGGYLTEHLSWRWVFYVNVPVGAVAFLLIWTTLPSDEGGRERPFDFLGYLALVAVNCSVQLMADRGQMQDWFYSPEIWTYAVLTVCGLYVFILQTMTSRQPFFHPDVLTNGNFAASVTLMFWIAVVLFTTNALLPTFMQTLLGYSAEQSGLTSMWRAVGACLAFYLAPKATERINPRLVVLVGIAFSVAGLWRMAHFDLAMPRSTIAVAMLLQGFGMALMLNPLAVLAYSTLAPHWRTEASVFSNIVRNMGGSLGIASVQAVLFRQGAEAHERMASVIVGSDPLIRWALPPGMNVAANPGAADALNAEITRQASMSAYCAVFAWLALANICVAPLLFLVKPPKRPVPPGRETR